MCLCTQLASAYAVNHLNNSNSADSYQSSFLLHRETVTRKTQAALMMA